MSSPVYDNIWGMVETLDARAIQFISLSDLQALLTVYFNTPYPQLLASENAIQRKAVKAMSCSDDGGPTTGESLKSKLSWTQVKEVISKLESKVVSVSGVQYTGRYVYVLACWVCKEDPRLEENILEFGPIPKFKQIEVAVKKFIESIERYL